MTEMNFKGRGMLYEKCPVCKDGAPCRVCGGLRFVETGLTVGQAERAVQVELMLQGDPGALRRGPSECPPRGSNFTPQEADAIVGRAKWDQTEPDMQVQILVRFVYDRTVLLGILRDVVRMVNNWPTSEVPAAALAIRKTILARVEDVRQPSDKPLAGEVS